MKDDLRILLRLQEVYESKLLLVSVDYDCSSARKGYEHEFAETKEILNLLNRLIDKMD